MANYNRKEVKKHGNPKDSDCYDTDIGRIKYTLHIDKWDSPILPTYYFEEQPEEQEIELPSEEQIKTISYQHLSKDLESTTNTERQIEQRMFIEGAEWMKSFASPIISMLKEKIAYEQNLRQRTSHGLEESVIKVCELVKEIEAKDKELFAIRQAEKVILEKLLSTDGQLQDRKRELVLLKAKGK